MTFFEWNERKAETNWRKHRISFDDAMEAFYDPNAFFEQDRVVEDEVRWQVIGMVADETLLLVAHTYEERDGDEVIRIISARRANRGEQRRYEQGR